MHIKQGVTFSDGSALQASDVVALLRLAKEEASYYAPRLANIASVRADGGDTVVVTLNRMNGNLPRLLDVPIIKKGSEEDKVALGTGGYVLQADEQNGGYILTAREGWHLGKNRPYARIELTKVGTVDELIFGFESHDIDLVTVDSTSADPIQFRGEYESREYPTTVMQYLGFNMRRDLFSNALVRQAVTCAIDRENAVEQDYARLADATLLPIHPASPAYDGEIAKNFSFSLENAKGFFTAAGYTDQNGDGKMDNGRRGALGFEILVNSENKSRCAVARRISQDLAKIGVTVTIREAKWEEYMRALEQGEFDAYLGEVNLTADFELDRLVRSGGALNYGRYASSDTDALLDAYHTATLRKSDETANFYQNFVLQAPIAPILFKKNTAITHRGFFETITPTHRNPYYHFFDWKPVKHG